MSILQKGRLSVVLGAQWGDEGKGKLSDILCGEAEVCARCQVCVSFLYLQKNFQAEKLKAKLSLIILNYRVVTMLATLLLLMTSNTISTCCLLVSFFSAKI
jgi:hypothetical protein